MNFDHLADPQPPVAGPPTRAAVARRATRLVRRRRRVRTTVVSALAVTTLGGVVAAIHRDRPTEVDMATPAAPCCRAVEGTVTDQIGVLGGVLVLLVDPAPVTSLSSAADPGPGPGWRIVARTMTDPQGRYRFAGVSPGQYALRFEDQLDQMVGKVRHQPAFLGGAEDAASGRRFTVPAGAGGPAVRADQRLELSPNHGLRGSVRESRSSYPIRNVTVRLYAAGRLVRQAVTDDQGRYDLGGLRAGTYRLAFVDESDRAGGRYAPVWAPGGEVVMPEDRDVRVDGVLTRS